MRYHLKCCVIVNALIECKIAFFKVVRQSLKSFYEKLRIELIKFNFTVGQEILFHIYIIKC